MKTWNAEGMETKCMDSVIDDTIQKQLDGSYKMLLETFMGIPTVIDKNLKGNGFYLCISPELHTELIERHATNDCKVNKD